MDTLLFDDCKETKTLIEWTHRSGQPVIVSQGSDECLVAMTPAVFERILFDTGLLSLSDRDTLRF